MSDPINTWGRVARAHRVELLEVAGGGLVARSTGPLFAEDQPLRSARMFDARAVAATADRIYAFDVDRLDAFTAFPIDHPIDRLAEAAGALIATSMHGDQLELALLDPSALDSELSARLINLLPDAELALSIDPSGLIAVPELGATPPDASEAPPIAVRVLSIQDSSLSSGASIELSLLHAQRTEPPHLVYGMVVAGRALAVSDAGAAALGDGGSPAVQSILFQ